MKYLISHQIRVLAECFKDYKNVWDIVPEILHLSFKYPRLSVDETKTGGYIGNYKVLLQRLLAGLNNIKDKEGKTFLRKYYGKMYIGADKLLETLNKLENQKEVPEKDSENELIEIVKILIKRAESLEKRRSDLSEGEKKIIGNLKDSIHTFIFTVEQEIRRVNEEREDLHRVEKKELIHTAKRDLKVYLDMDSCITDFDKAVKKLGPKAAKGLADGASEEEKQFMYDKIEEAGSEFWSGMDWYPKGQELWKVVKKYNPVLLSSPGLFKWAPAGKENWVSENLPGISLFLEMDKYIFAEPDAVLIDDSSSNLEGWKDAGGLSILYEGDPESVKKQLQEIQSQP